MQFAPLARPVAAATVCWAHAYLSRALAPACRVESRDTITLLPTGLSPNEKRANWAVANYLQLFQGFGLVACSSADLEALCRAAADCGASLPRFAALLAGPRRRPPLLQEPARLPLRDRTTLETARLADAGGSRQPH